MKEDYFAGLSAEERYILKEKGTEAPFSGEYDNFFEAGVFVCRACKSRLYESNAKFNSGCGWPSFDDEIDGATVRYEDLSGGRVRTEICCAKCDGHLGHVFNGEKLTKKNTRHCVNSLSIQFIAYTNLERATFGAGCFWQTERAFKGLKGIYLLSVGYMGGDIKNPTYKDVCKGDTNHAEVITLFFDPKIISYYEILNVFWNNHDPTKLNRQGVDKGTQYRSVIFYYSKEQKILIEASILEQSKMRESPIVTELMPASSFYRAEEYHQDYFSKNNLDSCGI